MNNLQNKHVTQERERLKLYNIYRIVVLPGLPLFSPQCNLAAQQVFFTYFFGVILLSSFLFWVKNLLAAVEINNETIFCAH